MMVRILLIWVFVLTGQPLAHAAPFNKKWLVPYLPGQERTVKKLRRTLRKKRTRHKVQTRYLLGQAMLEDKAYAKAERIFSRLIRSYPLLADYHRYYRAICLYRLKRFRKAEKVAAKILESSPLKLDAELVRGDALRALGEHEKDAAIWRRYLQKHPMGSRVGKAHIIIAESLRRQAEKDGNDRKMLLAEALEHYKQVLIKDPLGNLKETAAKQLALVAGELEGGEDRADLTPWQRFQQAKVFFNAMRHTLSEPAFTALLQEQGLSDDLRCKASYHLAKTVFRLRQRVRAVPLYEAAEKACHKAGKSDLVVKSLFGAARGLYRAKKYAQAIKRFGRIEAEFPSNSYADDARLLAAEVYETMKKPTESTRLLDSIPDKYPGGDMSREALWRLALESIIQKQPKKTLSHLDRILTSLGETDLYYARGRALYWKARSLQKLRRHGKARSLYERCIREHPLSYYALMAFNRLRESYRPLFRRLSRELIAPTGKSKGVWKFPARSLFSRPAFLRGVELARLGLGDDAARELASVGVKVKRGVATENLWLAAVLFDGAGLWHRSHYVPRRMDKAFSSSYPLKDAYRRWAIAYPRAFYPEVRASSKRAKISEHLTLSIMREESGFTPTIESWANAVGLMQLLVRTAQRAGKEHRMQVTRKRLQIPAVNIKLGTSYLDFLLRSFGRNPALAIAGYNAGEGSVLRWLRQRGKIPLDEFIDRIPYNQTRRYTKRVLSSLFTYSVLYDRDRHGKVRPRIPRLGQKLPRAKLARRKRPRRKKPRR